MAISFPSSPTDGQTYVYNNLTYTYSSSRGSWTGAVVSGGNRTLANVQTILSSTTYVVPDGVTSLKITAFGGGAGGVGGTGGATAGPGGSGGAGIAIVSVTSGASYTVTIGAGGNAGLSGGTTSFGTLVTATGGAAIGTSGSFSTTGTLVAKASYVSSWKGMNGYLGGGTPGDGYYGAGGGGGLHGGGGGSNNRDGGSSTYGSAGANATGGTNGTGGNGGGANGGTGSGYSSCCGSSYGAGGGGGGGMIIEYSTSVPASGTSELGTQWYDMISSRAFSTTYTNTSGKTIMVTVSGRSASATAGDRDIKAYVGGSVIMDVASYALSGAGTPYVTVTFLVPPGITYQVVNSGVTDTISYWWEMR